MEQKKPIAIISTEGMSKEEIVKKASEVVNKFNNAIEKDEHDNRLLSDNEIAFNKFIQSIEFPIKKKR